MNWTAFSRQDLATARLEGVSFLAGDALAVSGVGSLETAPIEFEFSQCIVCWNAQMPNGGQIDLEVRALLGSGWSPYLRLARWSDDPNQNTSFDDSADGVRLETDTLFCETPAKALQIRVHLE